MADRIVAMPLDELRAQPAGVVLAHIDADAESALEATHPAPFTIGVLSMLVFAIVGLATSTSLFATVGVLPIVLVTNWLSTIVLEKPTDRERAANATVTAATTEIIAGTQVIKTRPGREDAELERFGRVVDDLRTKRVRVALMKMLIDTAFSVLPQFAMILIIVVGAERVADGILAPGDLVQAVALFEGALVPDASDRLFSHRPSGHRRRPPASRCASRRT